MSKKNHVAATASLSAAAAVAVPSKMEANALPILVKMYNEGGSYLSADVGKPLADAGYIKVNYDDVQDDKVLCMLTDKGVALVPDAAKTAATLFTISDAIPVPAKVRKAGRSGSKYPFDKLEVGQSFHVPATVAVPDPFAAIASSVTGARRRYSEKTGENETVTVKTFKMENGKRVKGADGHYVATGTETVTREKIRQVRDFMAAAVGADDPNGAGARVWRVL